MSRLILLLMFLALLSTVGNCQRLSCVRALKQSDPQSRTEDRSRLLGFHTSYTERDFQTGTRQFPRSADDRRTLHLASFRNEYTFPFLPKTSDERADRVRRSVRRGSYALHAVTVSRRVDSLLAQRGIFWVQVQGFPVSLGLLDDLQGLPSLQRHPSEVGIHFREFRSSRVEIRECHSIGPYDKAALCRVWLSSSERSPRRRTVLRNSDNPPALESGLSCSNRRTRQESVSVGPRIQDASARARRQVELFGTAEGSANP